MIISYTQVVEASRMSKGKTPTRQILVTLKEAPITTLIWVTGAPITLGHIEPLRCFTCQNMTTTRPIARPKPNVVSSKAHKTEECLKAHKESQRDMVAICPNCAKRNHARSPAYSARKETALR